MSDYKLVPVEATPKDVESVWMYKGNDGEWKPFMNEQHRLNTIADGGWDVREFFATPIVQGEPVAWPTMSTNGDIELAEPYEKATNPAYWSDAFPVYAAPQPAEPQPAPDVEALVEALEKCITSMLDSGYRANALVIRAARTAIAANRKQGGGV